MSDNKMDRSTNKQGDKKNYHQFRFQTQESLSCPFLHSNPLQKQHAPTCTKNKQQEWIPWWQSPETCLGEQEVVFVQLHSAVNHDMRISMIHVKEWSKGKDKKISIHENNFLHMHPDAHEFATHAIGEIKRTLPAIPIETLPLLVSSSSVAALSAPHLSLALHFLSFPVQSSQVSKLPVWLRN